MSNSLRDKLLADLDQADREGKVRAERVREIVRDAVSQAAAEVQEGSSEIRTITKDAIATVAEWLQVHGIATKEAIAASVEGMLDGLSSTKEGAIAQTRTEIERLERQLDAEETELREQLSGALATIESVSQDTSANIRETIQSVIQAIRDSPEAELMQKRYAQLKAQLSMLRANWSANYGERYDEVRQHLDDAKNWYDRTRHQTQGEPDTYVSQKQTELETKMADLGRAIAQKESHLKRKLQDVWQSMTDLFQERHSSS
jgi:metal-responsive CopG/Arc/MetJ family transcriptional regulator